MEARNFMKLIFYFATNCPRRIVRDEFSCDELSGNLDAYTHKCIEIYRHTRIHALHSHTHTRARTHTYTYACIARIGGLYMYVETKTYIVAAVNCRCNYKL